MSTFLAIDFETDYGGAIPCIERPSPGGRYVTYLGFIPGTVLADLYRDWKIRLLDFWPIRVKSTFGLQPKPAPRRKPTG